MRGSRAAVGRGAVSDWGLCGWTVGDLVLDPWQVNGYVVNLFWAFDTHRQEKRTLNFRGSMLSHKGK